MKQVGFLGTLSIGIGSIIGGSILLVTGSALLSAGPSVLVALFLSTCIAALTACSFAELSTAFPESDGVYTFAKKIIGVQSAFSVGWIILLARIMISVLYAIGFSTLFTLLAGLFDWIIQVPNELISIIIVVLTAVLLIIGFGGTGTVINIVKSTMIAIILLAGGYYLFNQDLKITLENLDPFFAGGLSGLGDATGILFVTVQGFALIVAVAGDIKNPQRNIPKALFLSILFAFVIYSGLLLLLITVGFPPNTTLTDFVSIDPSTAVVRGMKELLGIPGFVLITLSGMLSMYSAMLVNISAASKLIAAMAADRNFPVRFSVRTSNGTHRDAIVSVALSVCVVSIIVPEIDTAGASSSLIFLLSFALVQGIAILLRLRVKELPNTFKTPLFPTLPAAGILFCISLAVYQGLRTPKAGVLVSMWLGLGVFLYWFQFARRAKVVDAGIEASHPELVRFRGRSPLFLIPVANPAKIGAILSVAKSLIPPDLGRLLLLSVAQSPKDWSGISHKHAVESANKAISEALETAYMKGLQAEALISVAPDPWLEFERVARLYRCDGIVLGMNNSVSESFDKNVVRLVNTVPSNVLFLKAPDGWQLPEYAEILVPTLGRSDHSELRARIFGSLTRRGHHRVSFFSVMREDITPDREQEVFRELHLIMLDEFPTGGNVEVVKNDDIAGAILKRAETASLLVLGMPRSKDGKKIIGPLIQAVIEGTELPVLLISKGDE